MMGKTLRLILGDQLNYNHSWYQSTNNDVIYLLMEMRQETDYVMHHAQKVIGFFAAMYNFAEYLRKNGHQVIHLKINDKENTQSLTSNLSNYIEKLNISNFEYQEPDEYRLDLQLKEFCAKIQIDSKMYSSEHFLTERDELGKMFKGKKMYLMETFYRKMRQKFNILMDENGDPIGGKWNFDHQNREKWKGEVAIPETFVHRYDYTEIWNEITKAQIKTFGNPQYQNFIWHTSRKDSLKSLKDFLKNRLPHFGKYQDAMVKNEWAMFHSRISFSLNTKMISPLEVTTMAIEEWKQRPEKISLSSLEGFIRQIIGWREYVRGIYWDKMPEYAKLNFFEHRNKLPDWFWSGDTKMNCMKQTIGQSLEYAYAHHIQRLMVTGNFALLAGINPDELDAWYLGIYIDAIEWVEITNTRGMSQFADGGIVGTKPYVSSAHYINKMSNYCEGCFYNKKDKIGDKSCIWASSAENQFPITKHNVINTFRTIMLYGLNKKNRKSIIFLATLDGS